MDKWSKSEKLFARELFELAKQRDYERLRVEIRSRELNEPNEIWDLREYLNLKAKEFENKYDYRYSILLDSFMLYLSEGLLDMDELKGLSLEKVEYLQSVLLELNNMRDATLDRD